MQLEHDEAVAMVGEVDRNGNNLIEFDEFVLLMAGKCVGACIPEHELLGWAVANSTVGDRLL